ncbi:MAG: hypothetical protein A3E87_09480 [Gammaproteobacteria bacterium RIFCSPHIGHO2_12_FULL_35_23]|nr:MAG: hypothetical protein A3E87_09480 [Gammaproteobacteria bacterium RIFCSPHIGHO2_12_FULL_35_23]
MLLLLINLLLAFIWATLTANFSPENIGLGLLLSFILLAITENFLTHTSYTKKVWLIIKFIGFIIWEIVISSCKVAICSLQPHLKNSPGVIAVPLEVTSDLEITLTANLISLTPGTLALDISTDKKFLFVHTMFANDPDKLRSTLKKDIEQRVIRILE